LIPYFQGRFSWRVEKRVKVHRSRPICWHFFGISGEQTFAATFEQRKMARKNDGACGNPKLIRTDVDCRAAQPKFNEGAWSPAKISDVTGGGLYLFATPDESRPGNAASKLWQMPHYRATRSTRVRSTS
jgi:hypothetical protein